MKRRSEPARRGGAGRSTLGRRRSLPNLPSANRALRFEAERIARNMPIQATAADILKLAMVELGKEGAVPRAAMVLTVHDELVFEVPAGRESEAGERISARTPGAMQPAVPPGRDLGWGKNWAQ